MCPVLEPLGWLVPLACAYSACAKGWPCPALILAFAVFCLWRAIAFKI